MLARLIAILLACLTAVSCDKVKSLAAKASAAGKGHTTAKGTSGESSADKVDADLQKLVDQTAEGTIFRQDLPFPTRLDVRTTRRAEVSGRVFQSSDLGKGSAPFKGTQMTISKLELRDSEVCFTLEQASISQPVIDTPAPPAKDPVKKDLAKKDPVMKDPAAKISNEPVEKVAPPEAPVTFRKSGNTWLAKDRTDFRTASLAQKLSPVFDQLLAENALIPRPQWFAKQHRFKVGDQLVVTDQFLPMLLAGNAQGSCTLKLESFDAVEGHPCGVFSITGNYHRKIPDFSGTITDENVTIESGKFWFSLLYPVILRQEMDTIQSSKGGSQGGLMSRSQGTAKVSVTHAWKRQSS